MGIIVECPKVNIYYAGLDSYSLPLGDGEKLVCQTSKAQVDYIKLLCLVSDRVIVPPSFYLYWAGQKVASKKLSELMDFYQAGYVVSAVHSTMSTATDFLTYKLEYGTADDKKHVCNNKEPLDTLFSEIPLFTRDVTSQSGEFKLMVEREVESGYQDGKYKEFLLNSLRAEQIRGGVIASREEVNKLHYGAFKSGLIGKHELRKYYYTTNKVSAQ